MAVIKKTQVVYPENSELGKTREGILKARAKLRRIAKEQEVQNKLSQFFERIN